MTESGGEQLNARTGAGVGLLVASAVVPGTFARSLSERSTVDQGLVTGLSTGLHYLLTVATQDMLQALSGRVPAGRLVPPGTVVDPSRVRVLAADLAAVPLGLALEAAVPARPGAATLRGVLHQVGWRLAVTGVGGSLLTVAEAGMELLDQRLGANGRVARLPIAVPVGLGLALVVERRRLRDHQEEDDPAVVGPGTTVLRPLAVAGAVVGALGVGAYAEHALATAAARRISRVAPGGPQLWTLVGHGACLGLLAAASGALYLRALRSIEAGESVVEPAVDPDEAERWTGPTVSGSSDSLVPWAALGHEGRRHAMSFVRPEPFLDRPAGTPDLSIATVMGEPAKATPIQVYVGLDSAPTARERADLAVAEMDRTGAFERSLLMLISPTGTGYVNYVATAAAAYLTRGDIATVTMQYSKRPSPLSMDRVGTAREQNRYLWLRILERLRDRSGPRPKVVIFGESLGAHTSQDAFLHWGTLGPQALGIDRALWIGTPYLSGWMHEITGPPRLDVDADTVAVVNDFAQLEALGAERRAKLRYVLVSHDNDGVTKFGPDLLATAPAWLTDSRPMPEDANGDSPRGIPPTMRWRPITTFFQSLVDMKNAQLKGSYSAWAHDYRPDLARFMSEVYDLPATPEQMAAIDRALAQRESYRSDLFADGTAPPVRA
jgi:uncharacterized membrane protein